MRTLVAACSAVLLSSCIFSSDPQGTASVLNSTGLGTPIVIDTLNITPWQASFISSRADSLPFIGLDSLRGLMIGTEGIGGKNVHDDAYFRVSVTDSSSNFLHLSDSAFLRIRIDSLTQTNFVNLNVFYAIDTLPAYGQTLDSAQNAQIYAAFLGIDTAWTNRITQLDQTNRWASFNFQGAPDTAYWINIPIPTSLLSTMRLNDNVKLRQALDFKITADQPAFPSTGNNSTVTDTASRARLQIGSIARQFNRLEQHFRFDGVDRKHYLTGNTGDSLKLVFSGSDIRTALTQNGFYTGNNVDSSANGPLVVGARLKINGFQNLATSQNGTVRVRIAYHIDSSYYGNQVNYFMNQWDSSAILQPGSISQSTYLEVGSALARALMQVGRQDSIHLAIMLSPEVVIDTTYYTRHSLSLLQLSDSLNFGLQLLYSPQKGIYTKEQR